MNVSEEVVWIDAMFLHQSGESGSVGVEMVLLHPSSFRRVTIQKPLNVRAHALVD